MRFGALVVDGDLATATGSLCLRPGFEQARHIEPDVKSGAVGRGVIGPDDQTVALVTGNGLKTQEAIDDHIAASFHVKPTVRSFEQTLAERGVAVGT